MAERSLGRGPLVPLLRVLAVEGIAGSLALVLAVTFGAHLLFARMPAPVESGYRVSPALPSAQALPQDPLRDLLRRDAHTLWLRTRPDDARVARELLRSYADADARALREAAPAAPTLTPAGFGYAAWLGRMLRLDLGNNRMGQRVAEELADKAPVTFALTGLAYLFALACGLSLALAQSVHASRRGLNAAVYSVHVLTTLPAFVVGYLLIAALRPDLTSGSSSSLALLTLTLSSGILSEVTRVSHQGLREQWDRPWVVTARVKGLRDDTAWPRPGSVAFHVARQGLVDVLPRLATRAPMVLGMSLLVEKVFVLEGLGDMLIDGLALRDESRVLVVLVLAVLLVQLCALATRAGHVLLDPRASRETLQP